jgi:hypothetical protein
MYSGTTLTPLSGRVLGAHQKLDKLARANLRYVLHDNQVFPSLRMILHFEGVKGPDAIKRKSPAKDEPWHYFDPFDEDDTRLIELIAAHYARLVTALKANDEIRAAFEAAWLAHAIVDGLTPAHHYPYEEELIELRGGEGIETRTTIKDKLVMPGETRRSQLRNNWKMWGPKGLLTTHGLFEWGVAAVIAPMQHRPMRPSEHDLKELQLFGVVELFRRKAKEVAALDMYEQYYKTGWTPKLAKSVRKKLVPTIVQMLTLAWYSAVVDAGLEPKKKV